MYGQRAQSAQVDKITLAMRLNVSFDQPLKDFFKHSKIEVLEIFTYPLLEAPIRKYCGEYLDDFGLLVHVLQGTQISCSN